MSKIEFQSIKNEAWREYVFPSGATYKIENPILLNVNIKENGDSHRVISYSIQNIAYTSHYIPRGWIAIRWQGKDSSTIAYEF